MSRPLLLAVVVETHRGLSLAYTYVVPASDVLPAASAVPHEVRVGDRQTLAAYLTQAALHCRDVCGSAPIVRVLDYHHPIPPDPSDPLCRVIREGNGEPVPDKNLTFTLDQLKAVHELMRQAIEHFKENEDGDPTD